MKNFKKLSFLLSFLMVSMLSTSFFSSYASYQEETQKTNITQMQEMIKKTQGRILENSTKLIEAISKGNLKEVGKLLKSKVNPETKDEKTGESALALAQRKLQEAESSSESEENISDRKLIVDLIKKEITNRNLRNPELQEERKQDKDLQVIHAKKEKLGLIKLINDLESSVQKFLNKKISQKELEEKADSFKYDIINYASKISEKNEANQTALSLAKEYSKIYQYNAKKKMGNLEWSKWMVYGDPVTNFWSLVITTLQNYGAK